MASMTWDVFPFILWNSPGDNSSIINHTLPLFHLKYKIYIEIMRWLDWTGLSERLSSFWWKVTEMGLSLYILTISQSITQLFKGTEIFPLYISTLFWLDSFQHQLVCVFVFLPPSRLWIILELSGNNFHIPDSNLNWPPVSPRGTVLLHRTGLIPNPPKS